MRCLWSLFALGSLLGAQGLDEPAPLRSIGMSVQAGLPTGVLSRDVNDQWGFGATIHAWMGLSDTLAIRGSVGWTGFRVNDRHGASRFLSTLFDQDSEDEALVLRTVQFGGDLVAYRDRGCKGPYLLAGGGLQRSWMSLDLNWTTHTNGETQSGSQNLATWEALHGPFLEAGIGHQWDVGFLEARFVTWRYRAESGYPLQETQVGVPLGSRQAFNLLLVAGVRFPF